MPMWVNPCPYGDSHSCESEIKSGFPVAFPGFESSYVTYLPPDLEQENLVSRLSLGKFPLLENGNENSSNLTELR